MPTENIDWSKAPEGATHWTPAVDVSCAFLRKEGEQWHWYDGGEWVPYVGSSWVMQLQGAVERPIEWSGKGLPPVGTKCEWLDPGSDRWLPVEIVFLSSWVIVVRDTNPHPDGSVDLAFDLINEHPQFRAVRTAEQIAAEAREASIKQMMKDVCCVAARDIFEDLYDAGYRKIATAGAQP